MLNFNVIDVRVLAIDAENGYGAVRALVLGLNSKGFPPSVQKNADNWLYYAMGT